MNKNSSNKKNIIEDKERTEISPETDYLKKKGGTELSVDVQQGCYRFQQHIEEGDYYSNLDLSHYKRSGPQKVIRKIRIIDD